MEDSKPASLDISVLQSKSAFMVVCSLPFFLVLVLALLPFTATDRMPPTLLWCELHGALKGPALGFLLLNCLTATIIASSKLGSNDSRRHTEEIQGDRAFSLADTECERGDAIAKDVPNKPPSLVLDTQLTRYAKGVTAAECATMQLSINLNMPLLADCLGSEGHVDEGIVVPSLKGSAPHFHADSHVADNSAVPSLKVSAPDVHERKGEHTLRTRRSLDGSFAAHKLKRQEVRLDFVRDYKKPIDRNRATDGNKARPGASRRNEKVRLQPSRSNTQNKQLIAASSHAAGHGNLSPSAPPGAAEHPSMDEVWASITISSQKGANSNVQEENSKRHDLKSALQPPSQPTATATCIPTQSTVASLAQPAAVSRLPPASANVNVLKAGKAAPNLASADSGGELEKLNRRSEQFIKRFNNKMRLQREQSLRRWKGECRPRYAIPPVHGGLLVG